MTSRTRVLTLLCCCGVVAGATLSSAASAADNPLQAGLTLIGSIADDVLEGTPAADLIDGGEGDDALERPPR
jgi:hypothetical protein